MANKDTHRDKSPKGSQHKAIVSPKRKPFARTSLVGSLLQLCDRQMCKHTYRRFKGIASKTKGLILNV